MSQLSPKARALLGVGRNALDPTESDRVRIQHALRARLGTAVPPPQPKLSAWPSWQLMSGAIVGAGVLSSALLLASRHPVHAAPPPVAAIAAAQISAQPIDVPSAQPEAIASTSVSASAPKSVSPAARTGSDSLAREVALLSRATSDLHTGRAADALKILDQHRREFPSGLLTEERRAARARALCALGRMSEAHAELARLAPQSPAAARAKQMCKAAASAAR